MKFKKLFAAFIAFAAAMVLVACGGEEHTHTFSKEWSSDAENHWHAADCEHTEEVSSKVAHTWDSGSLKKEASCTEKGERVYTCFVCKLTRTEYIDMEEHTYGVNFDAENHWQECLACGDKKDQAAHENVVTYANGYKVETCACGNVAKTAYLTVNFGDKPLEVAYAEGVYSVSKAFSLWNRVSLFYDGKQLTPENTTFAGAYSEAYVNDAKLYHEDGVYLYGGTGGKVVFTISYDAENGAVTIAAEPVVAGEGQVLLAKENTDGLADCVAVWNQAGAKIKEVTDASTGAGKWVGNGWRLYVVVDAEGRICYLVVNPPNGYGGPNGTSYYHHSAYGDYTTNPAFDVLDGFGPWVPGGFAHNLYEVVVPEGGFALTAHGTGTTAILDLLGVGENRGDAQININTLLAEDILLSYDAELGLLSVKTAE